MKFNVYSKFINEPVHEQAIPWNDFLNQAVNPSNNDWIYMISDSAASYNNKYELIANITGFFMNVNGLFEYTVHFVNDATTIIYFISAGKNVLVYLIKMRDQ